MSKITYVCETCGSDDVMCDAYAEWRTDLQAWQVRDTFSKGAYCNKCDGETRLEEKELAP